MLEGFFSVKDFNAVGDGMSDDTIAIQTCFNEAQKNKGTAYFPPGEYLITSTLFLGNPQGSRDNPFSIQGMGKGNSKSVIKMKKDLNMVESIGTGQIAIRELSFRHEGKEGIILYLEEGMNHVVADCSLQNVRGNRSDMLLFACSYVDIINTRFANNESDAYAIRSTVIGKKLNINSNIFDSRIYGVGKGLIIDSRCPKNRVEGLKVSRNMFLNVGREQITVKTVLHIDISNNMLDQACAYSILLDPADYSVCGAFISCNYISPAKDRENGVCIFAVDNERVMNGVNIMNNMLAYTGQGIVLGSNCNFFNVTGNMFSDVVKEGVKVKSSASVNVVNNTFWNCHTSIHSREVDLSHPMIVSENQLYGITDIDGGEDGSVVFNNNITRNDKILPY